MKIEILGVGCPNCETFYQNTLSALDNLNKKAEVLKVDALSKMNDYDTLIVPPTLVINDSIVSVGKLLSTEDIQHILEDKS